MKKFISFALSFLIIWALVTGGCYLLGRGVNGSDLTNLSLDISIGFAGALGGTFGPVIAAYISKLLKK